MFLRCKTWFDISIHCEIITIKLTNNNKMRTPKIYSLASSMTSYDIIIQNY